MTQPEEVPQAGIFGVQLDGPDGRSWAAIRLKVGPLSSEMQIPPETTDTDIDSLATALKTVLKSARLKNTGLALGQLQLPNGFNPLGDKQ